MSRSDSAPCIASEVTGLFGIAERPKILSGPRPTFTPSFKAIVGGDARPKICCFGTRNQTCHSQTDRRFSGPTIR